MDTKHRASPKIQYLQEDIIQVYSYRVFCISYFNKIILTVLYLVISNQIKIYLSLETLGAR